MQTLATFLLIILAIYLYLIYYHKIDTNNILDVMHTAFIRQLVFELIPFVVLFGTRDMHFINITNAANFFNSVIGRSMIGMIGFTFVSYVITAATPQKPYAVSIHTEHHEIEEENDEDEQEKEESQYISNNNEIEKFGNIRKYKTKKPTANDTQLLRYALI